MFLLRLQAKLQRNEYLNLLADANSTITLAEQSLEQAREKLKWSQILAEEKYISQTELKSDTLKWTSALIALQQANNNMYLLEEYTHRRTLEQLKSDVSQARMALERTKIKAEADVVQLEAALYEAKGKLEHQKTLLAKLEMNIKNTMIYAPADGMVVYAA